MVKREATLSLVKGSVKSLLMEYMQGLPRVKRIALQSVITRSDPCGMFGRKQEVNYIERLASRATYEFETRHLTAGVAGKEAMITEAWTAEATAWARSQLEDQIQRKLRPSRTSSESAQPQSSKVRSERPSSSSGLKKTHGNTLFRDKASRAGETPLKRRFPSPQPDVRTPKHTSTHANKRSTLKSPRTAGLGHHMTTASQDQSDRGTSSGFGPHKITASYDPQDRENPPSGPKTEDCIERVQNIVESWHSQSRSVAAACGCDKILELVDFYKLAVHELIAAKYEVSAMTMEQLNSFATSFAETCSNAMPQEKGATLEVANAMIQHAMGLRLGSRKQLWEETWEVLGCNSLSAQPRIDPNIADAPSSSRKKNSDQDESASVKISNTSKTATQYSTMEKTSSTAENRNNGHEVSQSVEATADGARSADLKYLPDHPNLPARKKKPKKRKSK